MSETILIKKRDGRLEEFSVYKVKEVIAWATGGLNVNPLELECKINEMGVEGVTTEFVHDNIIHHAQTLARADTPDWVYVAGRLNTMKRWKETLAYDMEFKVFVHDMISTGKYTHKALLNYSDQQMDYLETFINQDNDLEHSYGSTLTANKKYLLEGECIQQMFMVEAMIIFSNKSIEKVVELYTALSERKISLATPWLSNLRSSGNISSCFIISVDDNIESITESWTKAAKISKMGGGLGIYLGNLRASGSEIAGRPSSSKSVNAAVKVLNDIAVYFDQGGKRAGAFTVALPIWHNNIDQFLEIQSENGDQRLKAHDVFPQVCMFDLFMQIENSENKEWYTFCPHELSQHGINIRGVYGEDFNKAYYEAVSLAKNNKLQVFTVHNTNHLIKTIMRTQFETGLPYVAFVDTINEFNPNKHIGTIPCVNLCIESFSVVNAEELTHTCNLASVVAGRMGCYEDFSKYSGLLTEVLDAGIELTNPPIETSKNHNNSLRTIGIGIQGMHDWLVKNNKNYHNLEELTRVMEYIQYGAVQMGTELARVQGEYPLFKGSEWDNGNRINEFKKHSVTDLDWSGLQTRIDMQGIRNSQFTSPAPNTSTSVFMDAGAGAMPVYSGFFREDNDNGKYPISSMFLSENPLGYSYSFRHYNQVKLAEAVGAMQKFVDTGISSEYLFDQNKENFKAKDLYDLIQSAWKNKTKAIYYVRSIKKGETVDDLLGIKEEGCVGCSG